AGVPVVSMGSLEEKRRTGRSQSSPRTAREIVFPGGSSRPWDTGPLSGPPAESRWQRARAVAARSGQCAVGSAAQGWSEQIGEGDAGAGERVWPTDSVVGGVVVCPVGHLLQNPPGQCKYILSFAASHHLLNR